MREDAPIQFDEDIDLMLKAQQGDRQAYARLFEKYAPSVKRYLARRDGGSHAHDDLAQEVFTRVWQAKSRYQPLAPVRRYLLGVAANVLRENRVKNRHRIPIDIRELEAATDTDQARPSEPACSAGRLQAVRYLMTRLPARQRQAVELVCLAELTPAEAAERLDCSTKTLMRNVRRAKRSLRKLCETLELEGI